MSSTPRGPLGLITHRIRGYQTNKAALPEALTDQYRSFAAKADAPNTLTLAEALHAEALADQGRFTEALLAYDSAMAKYPDSFRFQLGWSSFLRRITLDVQALGASHPESAEFGRAYELLQEIGNVTILMHLSTIYHFALSGKPAQALDIAVRLKARAPNHPGLEEAIAMIATSKEEK